MIVQRLHQISFTLLIIAAFTALAQDDDEKAKDKSAERTSQEKTSAEKSAEEESTTKATRRTKKTSRGSTTPTPVGPRCNLDNDKATTGYFWMDNRAFIDLNAVDINGITESKCQELCTEAKDEQGHSNLCSAFSFSVRERFCQLSKSLSDPRGTLKTQTVRNATFFEKICLSDDLPEECAGAIFPRVTQALLVGHALAVKTTKTIEECLVSCIKLPKCKSAMFFPGDKECVLNSQTAVSKPDVFITEPEDRVEYFENGCLKDVKRNLKKPRNPIETKIEVPKSTTPKAKSNEASAERLPVLKSNKTATASKAINNGHADEWSDWSDCDADSGFKFRSRICTGSGRRLEKCKKGRLIQTLPCGDNAKTTPSPDSEESTETTVEGTPIPENEEDWGPWNGNCQALLVGGCIGTETRTCFGVEERCEGPSSRYCFPKGCPGNP